MKYHRSELYYKIKNKCYKLRMVFIAFFVTVLFWLSFTPLLWSNDSIEEEFLVYNSIDLVPKWKFSISKYYDVSQFRKYHPAKADRRNSNLPGEMGAAVKVAPDQIEERKRIYKQNNFDLFGSNLIALNRSLPDVRHKLCRLKQYPKRLPTTSVIIIFHNEPWSTLLRTVWSVINRSPTELIAEIILVDDASTFEYLKKPLENYLELLPFVIQLIRTGKREGLIRARLIGAKKAKGHTLTFFDAHTEVTQGWLEPLQTRIASDRSVVAVPMIDRISSSNMYYEVLPKRLNGFRWSLILNWFDVPEREMMRVNRDETAPLRTPMMVGCAFTVDREFFFEIGAYDAGMNIWGSENLEMALRVWQCGGLLEIIPCSHVGHLFRVSTYSFLGNEDTIKAKNNIRLTDVWLDHGKEFYLAVDPPARQVVAGDLQERQQLKKTLKCEDFQWYLDHVYPESNMLANPPYLGAIKNVKRKMCLDVYDGLPDNSITIYDCHGYGHQVFSYTKYKQIVSEEEICLGMGNNVAEVMQLTCDRNDQMQLWTYDERNEHFIHLNTGLCMSLNDVDVIFKKCSVEDTESRWIWLKP